MFCVYAHLNPATLVPFYIGKGKADRFKSTRHRSKWWSNHTRKHGFVSIKLVDGIDNESACEIEKQYIKKYGFLKSGGLLINLTSGGDGGNTFDPITGKNWNSGRVGVYSDETIQKMRDSRLGKKLSVAQKEKVLAGLIKASLRSLEVRTSKVLCITTGVEWKSRKECVSELGLTIACFKQRIFRDCPIKGLHLQLVKNGM